MLFGGQCRRSLLFKKFLYSLLFLQAASALTWNDFTNRFNVVNSPENGHCQDHQDSLAIALTDAVDAAQKGLAALNNYGSNPLARRALDTFFAIRPQNPGGTTISSDAGTQERFNTVRGESIFTTIDFFFFFSMRLFNSPC